MERIITDGSNIFSNRNRLYALSELSPRYRSVAREIKHGSLAIKDKASILVQNKLYCLARPTSDCNFSRAAGNIGSALKQAGFAANGVLTIIGRAIITEVI